jgi:hypothetical protein
MSFHCTLSLIVGVWTFAWVGLVGAQGTQEEPRHALIIGNGAYREAPLRNPTNDAGAMARTLRELGFTVLAHENATKRTMETAIIEFGRRLANGGVGFFYYAGHGLQVRGRNYLVPVDAEIASEAATRIAAVDVDLLLEQMAEAKNRVNVVILDACRNNPFERRLRGASRGLTAIDAARGTLIAYATAPGSVAADGEGVNGLYTEELLRALRMPGLKIEEVFKQVRVGVMNRSKGAQTPWESSSLTGDLVVNVTITVTVPTAPAALAAPAAPPTGLGLAEQPGCRVEPFQGATLPQGTIAHMHVVNMGSPCAILNYGVPVERGNPAHAGAITKQPAHGTAEFAAPHAKYTPEQGFVGQDEFAYEALARSKSDQQVRLKVRVKVLVVAP